MKVITLRGLHCNIIFYKIFQPNSPPSPFHPPKWAPTPSSSLPPSPPWSPSQWFSRPLKLLRPLPLPWPTASRPRPRPCWRLPSSRTSSAKERPTDTTPTSTTTAKSSTSGTNLILYYFPQKFSYGGKNPWSSG